MNDEPCRCRRCLQEEQFLRIITLAPMDDKDYTFMEEFMKEKFAAEHMLGHMIEEAQQPRRIPRRLTRRRGR